MFNLCLTTFVRRRRRGFNPHICRITSDELGLLLCAILRCPLCALLVFHSPNIACVVTCSGFCQARPRSARAQRACALRALGLLLADGTPTVGVTFVP